MISLCINIIYIWHFYVLNLVGFLLGVVIDWVHFYISSGVFLL